MGAVTLIPWRSTAVLFSSFHYHSFRGFRAKRDLLYFLSVTQNRIDKEEVIEITVDHRQVKLKLPGIAQDGSRLRLPAEGQNGCDLYVDIEVIQ